MTCKFIVEMKIRHFMRENNFSADARKGWRIADPQLAVQTSKTTHSLCFPSPSFKAAIAQPLLSEQAVRAQTLLTEPQF